VAIAVVVASTMAAEVVTEGIGSGSTDVAGLKIGIQDIR
jgi:hypothetical protein